MSVGIEPLASMVLVEIEQAAEQTTSGLLLPEEAREKMTVGTVVAVGPEVENVAEGDRVLPQVRWDGTRVDGCGIPAHQRGGPAGEGRWM